MELEKKESSYKSAEVKRKFFISAHPENEIEVQEISEAILSIMNSTCYFYKDFSSSLHPTEDDLREREILLEQMDVIILVVSRKLLEENLYINIFDYQYSQKNNILVLPILVEEGIAEVFNNAYGEHHLIEKRNDTFLKEIESFYKTHFENLIHLGRKISPFKGKIFISYRKKDKLQLMKLLKLLPSFDYFLNFEVWCDDYLIGGEDFNAQIEEQIKKCDFVILLVTKNLLEEDNYVQMKEYPLARSHNKKIIPLSFNDENITFYEEKYPGIEELIKLTDLEIANQKISNIIKEKYDLNDLTFTAEEIGELGIAYLEGNKVNKNIDLALYLLETAAEKGVSQTQYKIGKLYYEGLYFPQDTEKAKYWIYESFRLAIEEAQKISNSNEIDLQVSYYLSAAHSLYYLIDICEISEPFMDNYLNNFKKICEWLSKHGITTGNINVGKSDLLIAIYLKYHKQFDESLEFFNKSESRLKSYIETINRLVDWQNYLKILREKSDLYLKLGELTFNADNYYQSLEYLTGALKVSIEIDTLGHHKAKESLPIIEDMFFLAIIFEKDPNRKYICADIYSTLEFYLEKLIEHFPDNDELIYWIDECYERKYYESEEI